MQYISDPSFVKQNQSKVIHMLQEGLLYKQQVYNAILKSKGVHDTIKAKQFNFPQYVKQFIRGDFDNVIIKAAVPEGTSNIVGISFALFSPGQSQYGFKVLYKKSPDVSLLKLATKLPIPEHKRMYCTIVVHIPVTQLTERLKFINLNAFKVAGILCYDISSKQIVVVPQVPGMAMGKVKLAWVMTKRPIIHT